MTTQFFYSEILKNNTKRAILFMPKDENQDATIAKNALMNKVDPVDSNIHLSKVKKVNNGGFLLVVAIIRITRN